MTLLEVMVAIAILTFMMAITWRSFNSTARAKIDMDVVQERQHEIRIALNRIVADLESAYLSANENQSEQERRTVFIGKESGSVDELRFSSLGHIVLWADANESEQTLIAYQQETDPEDSSKTNLMRRESRRLSNENWENEPAEVDVLLRDIKKVSFEYFDVKDRDWKKRWNSTQTDGERGRMPLFVRIKLVLPGPEGTDDRTYTTRARLMMQEELRFFSQ
jgi:type II secretory pathway component PulJ